MQILSWNMRSVASLHNTTETEALTVVTAVMGEFDLIAVYEVSNSEEGKKAVKNLVKALSKASNRKYRYFVHANIVQLTTENENDDDMVAVIWDEGLVTVTDTTDIRRWQYSTMRYDTLRAPVYFNVKEALTTIEREFSAWHAPSPGKKKKTEQDNDLLIAQQWKAITHNAEDDAFDPLTTIVMGDFNADLSERGTRERGRFLKKQITMGSTTLVQPPSILGRRITDTKDFRTGNLYDQFFVDTASTNKVLKAGPSGIYDVINRLVNRLNPLSDPSLARYNKPGLAYDFYLHHISDHLPVALYVTL